MDELICERERQQGEMLEAMGGFAKLRNKRGLLEEMRTGRRAGFGQQAKRQTQSRGGKHLQECSSIGT